VIPLALGPPVTMKWDPWNRGSHFAYSRL
jgi:hypothetical protein